MLSAEHAALERQSETERDRERQRKTVRDRERALDNFESDRRPVGRTDIWLPRAPVGAKKLKVDIRMINISVTATIPCHTTVSL